MLARVGLIVCVGIFLTCASPVPQENNDPDVVDRTPALDIFEEQTTEIATEDPLANGDQASNPSVAQEGGNENEAESNTEVNETANNNEGNETESEPENSKNDEGSESGAGTNEPPIEDSDSKSESNENDSGNAHEDPVHGSDEDDSEDDDEHNDSDEDHAVAWSSSVDDEHQINLNVIELNDVTLRVYKTSENPEYFMCQEIKRQDKILEKICYISSPPPFFFNFHPREQVSVFRQHTNGQDFICQDITTLLSGSLQVLCASNKEHYFKQSYGLKKFIVYHKKSS
ncbi:uncharacterized protein LOC135084665 [Ostrinia nubilalis]|uniref:uncharacterized protein LOC135084665 n=1 Tax=Ostrinia nubilalis TaxID=29057 RepID=UPI0030825B58